MGRGPGRGRLRKNPKGSWVGYWSDAAGRRKSRDFGPKKAVAEQLLAAVILERDKRRAGLAGEAGLDMALEELVEKRVEYLISRGKTLSVVRRERCSAKQFIRVTRASTARDVTPAAVQRYQAKRRAAGISNRTINIDLKVMQRVFKHAIRLGLLERNPLAVFEALPETQDHRVHDRRALTVKETKKLLAAADEIDSERYGYPQAPILRMYLPTGARKNELIRATWGDVCWETRTLTLPAQNTKGRRRRVVDLSDRCIEVLESLTTKRSPKAPIFVGRRGRAVNARTLLSQFYEALERAGIEKVDRYGLHVDIHALRTTYGTRMAEAGVALHDLQKLLDHASPVTTAMFYAKPQRSAVVDRVEAVGGFRAVSAGV